MARLKMGPEIASEGSNTVADRALEILTCFTDDHPVRTAEELRNANNMSRSTIYRYLTSLRAGGFVAEVPGKGFRLGPKLIEMARIARRYDTVVEIAQPHVRRLAENCGEIVQLVERVGCQLILLDKIESRHKIGINYLRGGVLPSPAGSSAKVLIAFAPPEEFEELMNLVDLRAYTLKSITDPMVLRAQLNQVRKDGYAYNDEELDEGVRAIAAPIFNGRDVHHAVSVVGPAFRLSDDFLPKLIQEVKATAAQIGFELQKRNA